MTDTELKLLKSFPRSFINWNGEFIAHGYANEYFILHNCESDLDIRCKVLEWLSRGACTTEPYSNKKKNVEFNDFMRAGINQFLGTCFTLSEMTTVYEWLGNAVNHDLTVKFVESGYDFLVLDRKEKPCTDQ